jgi:sucrose-6-phosphate hydrolase SacC (GH32 family)
MKKESKNITRRSFIQRTGTVATGLTLLSGTMVTGNGQRAATRKNRGAFIYKTPSGTLKDNNVIWHEGTFYLFTMYGQEEMKGNDSLFNSVWLATSTDGVHWKDYGTVIKDQPFAVWALSVWKAGDRFILNHGSHSPGDILRLWQSKDLIHWEYLGDDNAVRSPGGQRLDCMSVLSIEKGSHTEWYGYATGGLLRSDDGVKWKWKEDFRLSDPNWKIIEVGGVEQIGGKYYLTSGWVQALPGDLNYSTLTFVSEDPEGPFRPDYEALRLNGHSGQTTVALWARFCRLPEELLMTNYIVDVHSEVQTWWHAPMKKAVADKDGHLRMGYWKGNDAIKGNSVPLKPGNCKQIFPLPESQSDGKETTLRIEGEAVLLERPPGINPGYISYADPRAAVVLLNEQFDTQKGFVLEGRMKVDPSNPGILSKGLPGIGLYFEEQPDLGTVVLFHTCHLTEIGTMRLNGDSHFDCRDRTGFGCAAVAGIMESTASDFRLLFRCDIFELYLNDLLVQTFCTNGATGRIGFIVRDGQAIFDNLRAWEMNL